MGLTIWSHLHLPLPLSNALGVLVHLKCSLNKCNSSSSICKLYTIVFTVWCISCFPIYNYFYPVVPSQVYALVGSEQKGQVLGGMVAAGAGKSIIVNCSYYFARYRTHLKSTNYGSEVFFFNITLDTVCTVFILQRYLYYKLLFSLQWSHFS